MLSVIIIACIILHSGPIIEPGINQCLHIGNLLRVSKTWNKIVMNNIKLLLDDVWVENKINKIVRNLSFYDCHDIKLPDNIRRIYLFHSSIINVPRFIKKLEINASFIPDISQHKKLKNIEISHNHQNITIPLSAEYLYIHDSTIADLHNNIKNIILYCNNQPIAIPLSAENIDINLSDIANPDLSQHKNLKTITIIDNNQNIIIPSSLINIHIENCSGSFTIPLSVESLHIENINIINRDLSQHTNLKHIKIYNNIQDIIIPLSAETLEIDCATIGNPDLSQHVNLKTISRKINDDIEQQYIIYPPSAEICWMA